MLFQSALFSFSDAKLVKNPIVNVAQMDSQNQNGCYPEHNKNEAKSCPHDLTRGEPVEPGCSALRQFQRHPHCQVIFTLQDIGV